MSGMEFKACPTASIRIYPVFVAFYDDGADSDYQMFELLPDALNCVRQWEADCPELKPHLRLVISLLPMPLAQKVSEDWCWWDVSDDAIDISEVLL